MIQAIKKKNRASQSVYGPGPLQQEEESHTLAIVVENEPGVLARVIGRFTGRGYNIDSLTVAETDHEENTSRITIVCSGTPAVIEQIKAQLRQIVPVKRVRDLTTFGPHIERELALIKVAGTGEKRIEALRLADVFRAQPLDSTLESFVFELTGTTEKVNAFIDLMKPLGLVDVSRTGIAAISRGSTTHDDKD
ncbi:MAG: acetolactate synthase small subunit [Alphaproteobacteria bacterium]|nr:acetolactate synthase small subunit [Alphaproteobacteria bacterium]